MTDQYQDRPGYDSYGKGGVSSGLPQGAYNPYAAGGLSANYDESVPDLLPPGPYWFTVAQIDPHYVSSQPPPDDPNAWSVKVVLTIYDMHGNEYQVIDYLAIGRWNLNARRFAERKVAHLLQSLRVQQTMTSQGMWMTLQNLSGIALIGIDQPKNPKYKPKNQVEDYVLETESSQFRPMNENPKGQVAQQGAGQQQPQPQQTYQPQQPQPQQQYQQPAAGELDDDIPF